MNQKKPAACDAVNRRAGNGLDEDGVWREFDNCAAIEIIEKLKTTFQEVLLAVQANPLTEYQDITRDPKNELTEIILIEEDAGPSRIISDIYADEKALLNLGPRAFEELIAELFRSQGFEVELTRQTRDGGYDFVAIMKIAGRFPMKCLVECKRYNPDRKVGIGVIRNLLCVVEEQEANKGIVATTSYFSRNVREMHESAYPYLLDLVDKDDLVRWISTYQQR